MAPPQHCVSHVLRCSPLSPLEAKQIYAVGHSTADRGHIVCQRAQEGPTPPPVSHSPYQGMILLENDGDVHATAARAETSAVGTEPADE